MKVKESWYKKLNEKYGYDFCLEAGYFKEDRPWSDDVYANTFYLPKNTTVIQYSGAFYPIHEGHVSVIRQAIDAIVERDNVESGMVVIHVDHLSYRISKGNYSEIEFLKSFRILESILDYKGFDVTVVYEDSMFLGCSRNFTRLYSELSERNNKVYFLSGGDRANFALTFIDEGNCIIAGRSNSKAYQKYSKELSNDRIWFIEGDHPASSTQKRNGLNDN